jgi:hypothetical protein
MLAVNFKWSRLEIPGQPYGGGLAHQIVHSRKTPQTLIRKLGFGLGLQVLFWAATIKGVKLRA